MEINECTCRKSRINGSRSACIGLTPHMDDHMSRLKKNATYFMSNRDPSTSYSRAGERIKLGSNKAYPPSFFRYLNLRGQRGLPYLMLMLYLHIFQSLISSLLKK